MRMPDRSYSVSKVKESEKYRCSFDAMEEECCSKKVSSASAGDCKGFSEVESEVVHCVDSVDILCNKASGATVIFSSASDSESVKPSTYQCTIGDRPEEKTSISVSSQVLTSTKDNDTHEGGDLNPVDRSSLKNLTLLTRENLGLDSNIVDKEFSSSFDCLDTSFGVNFINCEQSNFDESSRCSVLNNDKDIYKDCDKLSKVMKDQISSNYILRTSISTNNRISGEESLSKNNYSTKSNSFHKASIASNPYSMGSVTSLASRLSNKCGEQGIAAMASIAACFAKIGLTSTVFSANSNCAQPVHETFDGHSNKNNCGKSFSAKSSSKAEEKAKASRAHWFVSYVDDEASTQSKPSQS